MEKITMPKQPMHKMSFNLPEKWWILMGKLAEREGCSKTEIIKRWIRGKCLYSDKQVVIKSTEE
jgi:hypothetical protein